MSVTGHSPITPSPTRAHPHAQRNPLYGNAKRGRAPSYGARSAVTPTPIKHLSASSYDPTEDVALQPYGYTGRRYDNETDLWYFRARYFDAELGRFISRDPLGYVDGYSMYRGYFAPNGVDPSGLRELPDAETEIAIRTKCAEIHGTNVGNYQKCLALERKLWRNENSPTKEEKETQERNDRYNDAAREVVEEASKVGGGVDLPNKPPNVGYLVWAYDFAKRIKDANEDNGELSLAMQIVREKIEAFRNCGTNAGCQDACDAFVYALSLAGFDGTTQNHARIECYGNCPL